MLHIHQGNWRISLRRPSIIIKSFMYFLISEKLRIMKHRPITQNTKFNKHTQQFGTSLIATLIDLREVVKWKKV